MVEHPVAELPFELSATCQALPGANPNGPTVCPPGSGTARSGAFVRNGQTFSVTLPVVPAQSQARIDFQTQAHCPPAENSAGEPACFGVPTGNFTITADVGAVETESNEVTNVSTTNVFLFPPDVQYAVEIVSAPATATPGSVVEYEFEVSSLGLQPSDLLEFNVDIRGEAGTMIPLSATNHPFGGNGSTLPNTELQAIDCLSVSLGAFPPASVFPASPAPWQTCPSSGLIPIPTPVSPSNSPPVTGFPAGDFLQDLPGTLDGPAGGGVMRFRAQVLIGDPVCVDAPDSGVRELVFEFSVQGLQGTDLSNQAAFNGQNDLNGWIPAQDSAVICPPPGPELSLQKRVSPQIALPGSVVTYTVTVINIGAAAADGAVFVDPLPPALLADNPSGYTNVSCTDVTASSFVPNPQGTAVCPIVVSNAGGLNATIATFGANTALQFTYQAVMPATGVSIDNLGTVSAPSPSGLSFGSGTAQSRQNVQVVSEPGTLEPDPLLVPVRQPWALIFLAVLLMIQGAWQLRAAHRRIGSPTTSNSC